MPRILGISFGLATHALFAVTVWQLYGFLAGATTTAPAAGNLWVDALLAAQFVIPHSVLLLPAVRARLNARDSSGLLRLLLLRGYLRELAGDVCRVAANATGPVAGDGHYAVGRHWSFLGLVGSAVLQPAPDRLGVSNRFDAVALLAAPHAATAQTIRAARRLLVAPASRLFELSRLDLVYPGYDHRPCRFDRHLERIHLSGELFEGPATPVLRRQRLSQLSSGRARLSRHAAWPARSAAVASPGNMAHGAESRGTLARTPAAGGLRAFVG